MDSRFTAQNLVIQRADDRPVQDGPHVRRAAETRRLRQRALQYLRQSFARLDAAVDGLTPANALDPAAGRYRGKSTRIGLITLPAWHGADHYGQLVMYLRTNGIVPP